MRVSKPFQDSIRHRLPIDQAATCVEELRAWQGSAQGRESAGSSQQLDIPPRKEGGGGKHSHVGLHLPPAP